MPFIAHWKQDHFVVVYKFAKGKIYISDPAHGLINYTIEEFKKYWCSSKQDGEDVGIALLLDPTPTFYEIGVEKEQRSSISLLTAQPDKLVLLSH